MTKFGIIKTHGYQCRALLSIGEGISLGWLKSLHIGKHIWHLKSYHASHYKLCFYNGTMSAYAAITLVELSIGNLEVEVLTVNSIIVPFFIPVQFLHIQILIMWLFRNTNNMIIHKFYAWHESYAVLQWAKIYDQLSRNWISARQIFHRISVVSKKVECAPVFWPYNYQSDVNQRSHLKKCKKKKLSGK